MKSLDIRVAFSAIDRFTRPVNAARQSAGGLSDSLRKTQSTLKGLDKSSATFQRMTAAVGKTDRSISRARARFDGLSEAQRKNGTLTEKQQILMSRLGERLDRLTAKRVTEVARLRESASALRQHGVMLSGSSATIGNAIRRTEQYNQSLEREKRQLAAVTQARKRYEGAQQMVGKLRSGGAIALGTATATGYGAGRFLSPAVGFDEEMSNVQALTRLDKSDSQLAALRTQAKKLGAETAFTTRDAASGQAFLAMAGFTPDAIRAALPGVLNMALAGSMELGETADIGSNILSQFALDAGEMDRVSDVLTGTFTRTNTTLSSLGETMKVVGPVAAGLGISLEEAAAMTGTLARVGIRGSEAGTAMRRSLSRLASLLRQPKRHSKSWEWKLPTRAEKCDVRSIFFSIYKNAFPALARWIRFHFSKISPEKRVLRVSSRWSTAQVMATSSHSMNKLLKRIKIRRPSPSLTRKRQPWRRFEGAGQRVGGVPHFCS